VTSTDERARAVMRAYADTLQPPPVSQIIARAEQTGDAPTHSRGRPRLVLVVAAVVAAAVAGMVVDRLPDRTATTTTTTAEAPPSAASTGGYSGLSPGCPPGLPLIDGVRFKRDATPATSFRAKAGQDLTLTATIPDTPPDRQLLSFTLDLVPPMPIYRATDQDVRVVTQAAAILRPKPSERVFLVLRIPAGSPPGTYYLVGHATWPGPSLCVGTNPPGSTMVGASRGILGLVDLV
jgi:hypothetical protein